MTSERAPMGLVLAGIGAAILAVSVMLPWYGLSVNSAGADYAHAELVFIAQHYGNSALQAQVQHLGSAAAYRLVGHQITTVSAHEAMPNMSLALLGLAAVALLASLFRLADMRGTLYATGGQIALVGLLASLIVGYSVASPPIVPDSFLNVRPDWGVWAALVSAVAIFGGGLYAGSEPARVRTRPKIGPGPPPLGRYGP